MDSGDQRFSQPRPNGEKLLVDRVDFLGIGVLRYFHQVHPGAERLPIASEHNRTHGRVAAGIVQRPHQGAAKLGIQGVTLVGPVEGEPQQASLANGIQYVGHRVWGRRKDRLRARSTP